ncbi:MAG: hypothetical protein V1743_03680 [Nanoarchaeota archaeon]
MSIDINRKEIVRNLLKPHRLVFVGVSESKNISYRYVHDLYFQLSKHELYKIPASIKPKSLYVITIFKIRTDRHHEKKKYR